MSAETETITQAYRYALRVTPGQEARLLSFTGAARFAFNWGLALVKGRLDRREEGEDVYLPWSYHSRTPSGARSATRSPRGAAWSLTQPFSPASRGWAERSRDSAALAEQDADCRPTDARHVKIPRLGIVRSHERLTKLNRLLERDPKARIVRATVTRQREGKWSVSFPVERSPKSRRPRDPNAAVGVDLGLRKLAVISTGRGG